MEKKDISLLSMLFRASETNLLNVCTNYLENKYGKHNVFKSGNNFVYATGDIPILLVAGEDDPVGNYGKGVIEVYNKLREQGINADCILYSEARHEILNDFTYECVKHDIITFCKD